MTIKEAFADWKKSADKCYLCVYGGIGGGPGFLDFCQCKSDKHPNVRYGHEFCPDNCKEYHINTDKSLYDIFLSLYKYYQSYYNKLYNIDEK